MTEYAFAVGPAEFGPDGTAALNETESFDIDIPKGCKLIFNFTADADWDSAIVFYDKFSKKKLAVKGTGGLDLNDWGFQDTTRNRCVLVTGWHRKGKDDASLPWVQSWIGTPGGGKIGFENKDGDKCEDIVVSFNRESLLASDEESSVPATYGPDNNLSLDEKETETLKIPKGKKAKLTFTSQAAWENAVCIYDADDDTKLAERGNGSRTLDPVEVDATLAEQTIFIAGFHKEGMNEGGKPWIQSKYKVTEGSHDIGFEDGGDADYKDIVVQYEFL